MPLTNLTKGTTVDSEGGSATTNLTQGLAKVWADINAGQGGYGDSFNTTSITDNGTGDATITHVNDMSSASYSATTSVTFNHDGTGGHRDTNIRTKATGIVQLVNLYTLIQVEEEHSLTLKQTQVLQYMEI